MTKPIKNNPVSLVDEWKCDGWEEPVKDRIRAAQAMSFREKLIWLEAATKTARHLMNAPVGEPPAYARKPLRAVAEEQAPYLRTPDPRG